MKVSKLIGHLKNILEKSGDSDVSLECEMDGERTRQKLFDVLCGGSGVLLISKEAMDEDPLTSLPVVELQ